MRILGIDPGYERCGIAVIEKLGSSKETVVFSTCLRTSAKDEFPSRLASIATELETVIDTYRPDSAAIEELYFGKSSTTGLKVAEVRGMIRYLLERNGIPCREYHPNAIKIAITGYGAAKKEDIAFMVPKLVAFDSGKKIDDELDAVAVALTHLAHSRESYPQLAS